MSWEQLASILKENRQIAADEKRQGPLSCPLCGSRLDVHPKTGRRVCQMGDGYSDNGGGLRS